MATSSVKDDKGGHPFPEDLVIDILQRLPIVSLLRFECVSKNWYTLIKSPFFARKHINYNKKDKRRPKILIHDSNSYRNYFFNPLDNSIPPITFISFPNDNYNAKRLLERPDYLQKFRSFSQVVGPVDGLFLLVKGNYHIENVRLPMWNPATREVIPLPEFHFQDQPPHYFKYMYFGFVFDPVTSDFKVVWSTRYMTECHCDPRIYPAVYLSSTDSWRVLEHYKMVNNRSDYIGEYGTAYLDGSYFWLQRVYEEADKYIVFSFDFSNEVFTEIPGPEIPGPDESNSTFNSLMVLDDLLTICAIGRERFNYNLWSMIQPGVWNKVFTFRGLSNVNYTPRYCGFWDSSTVIFQTEKYWLVSYDVRTEEMRHLGYGQSHYMILVMYYKESLVTIKRGNKELDHCSLLDFFDSRLHLSSEFCDLDDLLDASWLYQ